MKVARLVLALFAGSICATAVPSSAEDLPYDHMHLTTTDHAAALEWYMKYMGGEDVGHKDRLKIGDTWFIFFKRKEGFLGSVGSTVDHFGISFPDLDAKMTEFRDAGIKITGEAREIGPIKFGFIEDPWGTRIEVMQDPDMLGFHHIHLKGPEPAAMLDWYENAFGGERTKFKGLLDAIRYDKVWLQAQDSQEAMAPTKGRAIDHLGWEVPDMAKTAKELKDKGVKFTMEPIGFPRKEIATFLAIVEDPSGTTIELVQRP